MKPASPLLCELLGGTAGWHMGGRKGWGHRWGCTAGPRGARRTRGRGMEPRGSGWCEAGAWDTRGFSSLLSPWKLQNKGKLCKTHCTRTLVPNRHVVRPAKALAPGERDLVSVRSFSAHGGCPSRSCVLPGVSSSAGAVQRPGGSPPRPPPPGLSPAPRWLSEGQRGTGSLLQEPAALGKALAAQGGSTWGG